MQTQIVDFINNASKNVVLRHPNRVRGIVFCRAVADDAPSESDNYGGIGTLDPIEDTESVNFARVGGCTTLTVNDGSSTDRGRIAGEGEEAALVSQSIRLIVMDDECECREPSIHDIIMFGTSPAAVGWEIVGIESDVHMGGGTKRYILEYRDELSWWKGE